MPIPRTTSTRPPARSSSKTTSVSPGARGTARTGACWRYTYLYDLATLGQLGGAQYDQRTQVLSLEGVYRRDQHWEFAGKLARREGEVRFGRGTGKWFDSATTFAAAQVRYELVHRWHAMAEAPLAGRRQRRHPPRLDGRHRPFVELAADGFETVEGSTGGLPSLSIAGTVDVDLVIDIAVTGGTAVPGTDFTTPGGGASFSVVVPAGTYDGNIIPLGLAAIGNDIIDGSRTVKLTLQASPDYVSSSTTVCGVAANTEATSTWASSRPWPPLPRRWAIP